MKIVSKLALGAVLALGVTSVATMSPAQAQRNRDKPAEEAAKPRELKLSKKIRVPISEAQTAITAKDTATATAKLAEADALAEGVDEKYAIGSLRLQLATANNDTAGQRAAVDAMIASGGIPPADLPKFQFYAGNFAYNANEFPRTIEMLTAAQQAGYVHVDAAGQPTQDLNLLLAEAHFKSNQVPQGLAFVERAVEAERAAGRTPPGDWYSRAISTAYEAKLGSEVSKWTRLQVQSDPNPENWRRALVIYRDSTNLDAATNLDLLRLMRSSKSLASERDYLEYAQETADRGLPGETKAVIDEGAAAGVVNKSNRAVADVYSVANTRVTADRASLGGSEKQAASAADGKIAASTGDAYLSYGDDAKAATMYQLALQKGGVDANVVNTRLGIALARSGQKDAARAAFQAVTGPRADLAAYWMLWLDRPVA